MAETIREHMPRRLQLEHQPSETFQKSLLRLFRLNTLSPRERTLYYYLSILRRAGKRGFRRRESQTPNEYNTIMAPHLPTAQPEMGMLTDDFVEARYSTHPIDSKRERKVRTRWKKVRAAIQTLKQKKHA
jgi:hypothetical protein